MIRRSYKYRMLIPALLAAVLLTGCTYQTVSHLKRQPWTTDQTQVLDMDYLRFEYMASSQDDGLRMIGAAHPKPGPIPGWAEWIDDLWVATYLSDAKGRVLARKITVISDKELDFHKGIEFDFKLEPDDVGHPGPVFVSFGYRMVLTAFPYAAAGTGGVGQLDTEKDVFFASESALSRF